MADALAALSSMITTIRRKQGILIHLSMQEVPDYYLNVEEEIDDKMWFYDIKRYIEKWEYPKNASFTYKRTFRR